MLEVKGTGVIPIARFIRMRFGEEGFNQWLDALSPEARNVYSSTILATNWYPAKNIYIDPDIKMCELFFRGDIKKGAWECGRHVAEYGLKGVYSIFVKLGTPQFLVKKASSVLPTYFRPVTMEVGEFGDKDARVRITSFPEIEKGVEFRIAGWIEKALEICGCLSVKVEITQSLTANDPYTEFHASWI